APAHGGREGTGMRIQGEDLARVVVAGLAAAFLAGLLTALWTAPEPLPRATLIGAVVVIGLITAAGYRHAGALAAAGAVLTLLGAAQLYSVSITPLAMREEARSGREPVDEMLPGPAHGLRLGCLLPVRARGQGPGRLRRGDAAAAACGGDHGGRGRGGRTADALPGGSRAHRGGARHRRVPGRGARCRRHRPDGGAGDGAGHGRALPGPGRAG